MPAIFRGISKGQLVSLLYAQDQVAASQAAVALFAMETFQATAPGTLEVTEQVIPFDFDLVAISVSAHQARTGGTLTVDATIDGAVTGLQAQLTATVTNHASGKQPREADRGRAGQRVGVKLTTDAGWTPVTADIAVQVWLIAYLEGI